MEELRSNLNVACMGVDLGLYALCLVKLADIFQYILGKSVDTTYPLNVDHGAKEQEPIRDDRRTVKIAIGYIHGGICLVGLKNGSS